MVEGSRWLVNPPHRVRTADAENHVIAWRVWSPTRVLDDILQTAVSHVHYRSPPPPASSWACVCVLRSRTTLPTPRNRTQIAAVERGGRRRSLSDQSHCSSSSIFTHLAHAQPSRFRTQIAPGKALLNTAFIKLSKQFCLLFRFFSTVIECFELWKNTIYAWTRLNKYDTFFLS